MNISEKARNIVDNCRFCWMCRHVCPTGNATGQERNTARARALAVSLVARGAEKLENVIENVYECMLCGACTNNCMTGWDPKVFIREIKTDAALSGMIPDYIKKLLDNYEKTGNVYGEVSANLPDGLQSGKKSDILFIAGQDARYKSPESLKGAIGILKAAGADVSMDESADDTGAALWFLTGKTGETVQAAKNCAKVMNGYKTTIVYDPVDLSLIRHEYKEWGIDVSARVYGFNEYLLEKIETGELKVKNKGKAYTVQDHYAYSRELDDVHTVRKIIAAIGVGKETMLHGKEADAAGSLIMNEYMPSVMRRTAENRWERLKNTGSRTVVTESPAEYELLKRTCPDGYEVLTTEQAIAENL